MGCFTSYILRQTCEKVGRLGDRLAKIGSVVNWERFRTLVKAMYRNDTPRGGRPNIDEVTWWSCWCSSSGLGARVLGSPYP